MLPVLIPSRERTPRSVQAATRTRRRLFPTRFFLMYKSARVSNWPIAQLTLAAILTRRKQAALEFQQVKAVLAEVETAPSMSVLNEDMAAYRS